MKQRRPPAPTGSVTVPAPLFSALLAVAQGRMTKAGHVAILATQEPYGICNSRFWRDGCGPTCLAVNATLAEAALVMAEHQVPRQLGLVAS